MINPFRSDISKILSVAAVMLLILLVVDAGCTQPAVSFGVAPIATGEQVSSPSATMTWVTPAPVMPKTKSVAAIAHKPDGTKIIVTFTGGKDADQLMELETSITDSKGTVRTQSMGSRLGTTPVQAGGKDTFYGPFTEKAHVVTIGHFADGTHQDILDTWV